MANFPTSSERLRAAATAEFNRMQLERRTMLHPTDVPRAEVDGAGEPVRLLLLGNGLAHGWGVASHQLAPTGELARGYRTLTGAACVVEYAGDAAMTAANAKDWLPPLGGPRFDAAVVAVGANCVARFVPGHEWRLHVENLLGSVRSRLVPDAPIVFVGVPEVFVGAREVRRLPRIQRPHAALFDHISRSVVEELTAVSFLPAPRLRGFAGTAPDESLYAAFTTPVAVALAGAIDRTVPGAAAQDRALAAEPPECAHPVVEALVQASRWDELPELEALLVGLKHEFGVVDAAVTLVGSRSAWMIASGHGVPNAVPRVLTYSHEVVETGRPLLVPDARKDPRFADVPLAKLYGLTFFLGVPLRLADGTVIGTLALFDREDREVDGADIDRLASRVTDVLAAVRPALTRTDVPAV